MVVVVLPPADGEDDAAAGSTDGLSGLDLAQLMAAAQEAGVPNEQAYEALNSPDQKEQLRALIRDRTPADDLDGLVGGCGRWDTFGGPPMAGSVWSAVKMNRTVDCGTI